MEKWPNVVLKSDNSKDNFSVKSRDRIAKLYNVDPIVEC